MAGGRGSHARGRDGCAAGVAASAQRAIGARVGTRQRRRVRLRAVRDSRSTPPCAGPSGRGGVAFSNAHQFGYSISAEEGGRWTATAEASHGRVRGTSSGEVAGSGIALTARRAILPAARSGATMCSPSAPPPQGPGAMTPPRNCSAPRAAGRSAAGFGFGLDAIGLLRGFDEDAVVGTRAAVVNVDYRLPLWRDRPRRRHHSRLSAHGARCGVLRCRPGVVETASAGATSGHPSGPSFRPIRSSASRLPVTFTAGAAVRHDGTTDRSIGSWPSRGSAARSRVVARTSVHAARAL